MLNSWSSVNLDNSTFEFGHNVFIARFEIVLKKTKIDVPRANVWVSWKFSILSKRMNFYCSKKSQLESFFDWVFFGMRRIISLMANWKSRQVLQNNELKLISMNFRFLRFRDILTSIFSALTALGKLLSYNHSKSSLSQFPSKNNFTVSGQQKDRFRNRELKGYL